MRVSTSSGQSVWLQRRFWTVPGTGSLGTVARAFGGSATDETSVRNRTNVLDQRSEMGSFHGAMIPKSDLDVIGLEAMTAAPASNSVTTLVATSLPPDGSLDGDRAWETPRWGDGPLRVRPHRAHRTWPIACASTAHTFLG